VLMVFVGSFRSKPTIDQQAGGGDQHVKHFG
jgi:hypothetical protein